MMAGKLLKSCPFCGKSVAEIDDAKELEDCPYFDDCDHAEYEQCSMHSVVCNIHKGGCGASSGYYVTVEDAVDAWNRRAERTCHVERVSTPYHVGPPRCSACMMPLEPLANYCPYCGARAVRG